MFSSFQILFESADSTMDKFSQCSHQSSRMLISVFLSMLFLIQVPPKSFFTNRFRTTHSSVKPFRGVSVTLFLQASAA